MTLITFYRITHRDFPELNYIGSTKDSQTRKYNHRSCCFNEISNRYNLKIYQFIRNNNINFDELQFEKISEINFKNQ